MSAPETRQDAASSAEAQSTWPEGSKSEEQTATQAHPPSAPQTEEAKQEPVARVIQPLSSPAPTSPAQDFRLAADPPRVMRLSPKALGVIGLVAGIGIGGSLIYGLRVSHREAPPNLIDTNSVAKSDVVTANPATYDKVAKLGPPLPGDLGRPILTAEQNGQLVPAQTGAQAAANNQRQVAAQQARDRAVQERASVLGSHLFLAAGSGTQASGSTSAGPALAGGAPGAGMPGNASDPSTGAGNQDKDASTSGQASKRAFMQMATTRTLVSGERLAQAASPKVVQAGSIIPAALITGIRSDLPGQITAQVTQNVYDSPTGRILLIPQGSRLIGEYDSQISGGQSRVLMAWDRLILADGRSILLDRQPGADASGAAGLQDRTNYHWGNLLKAAAISTMLGVGTQMATDSNDQLLQALRYGTQDTINQTGKQLVQRELGIAPTLTIRPGYPLRVLLTRDLVLEAQGEGR